ncbi:MAG: hypothetical protein WKH64_08145 [Chloroflexia bacterium]
MSQVQGARHHAANRAGAWLPRTKAVVTWGCVAARSVLREVAAGYLRQLDIGDLDLTRYYEMITHRSRYYSPAAESFMEFTRKRAPTSHCERSQARRKGQGTYCGV